MSDRITYKVGSPGDCEQAITFHSLSDDDELANHEILDRLFRSMDAEQRAAEFGWLRGKYGIS